MEINGRHIAALVMILAGAALAALGSYAAVAQRLTGREVLGGFALLLVAAIAALWLRLPGGRS